MQSHTRMRSSEWTVPEVDLALMGLKKITVPEFEILASFELPPEVVLLVVEAVQTLLGAEDLSWESARSDLLQERSSSLGSSTPSVEFSKMLATNKFGKEYPKPAKPKKHAVLVKKILSYRGEGKDPRSVTESIRKYVTHPEFTPENAALASRAARALCVWVQAIDMNFQEKRKKPPRNQIEQAIKKGQSSAAGVFNMQVTRLLPMISKITGKKMDSKEYDDLQASKNYIMRRIFKDKHKEARKAISSISEETTSAPDTYERDVDLRASHEAFRKRLEGRVQSHDLRKREEPRLVSLCKFNDRAFQPEAAGLRSWERFHNFDPLTVSFQDAEPRPCTVERKVRRSEDLNRLYKSDILIKQLLKALDSSAPDDEMIRKLVSAGANLDYVDEKGNTVYDIIRDKRLFISLHILDRIVQEKRNTGFVPSESTEKTKKRNHTIHLPVIELPRPRSFQQNHRSPMDVKTYRKQVAPEWEPKFHLTDPNEVLSDSDVEEEEEEEVIDPVERKRENILRYCDFFNPPLTPPNAAVLDETPMELPEPTEEEPASPSLAGVEEQPSEEELPPDSAEEDPTFFLTDGARLSLMTPEDSSEGRHSSVGSQQEVMDSLAGSPSISEAGSPMRRSGTAAMLEAFEELQRESVAKKKHLFDIYKGSTDRGGIDDPASNSSAHQYLRLCEQLGLLPRPLAFGRANQKDLNLQGFGLYPRHAQALALSIRGLESCTSLNLQENKLGDEGLASLCKVLVDNTTIVSLNLSFNDIRTSSQHICDLLENNTTLKHLNLEGNDFPDKHLAKLVTSVSDPDVRDSLSIAGNMAGRHTTPLLVKLVATNHIRTLDLCWMGLGKKFAEALSLVLDKNVHLKVLKLAWNGICDESVTMLSRCFTEAAFSGKMKLEVLDLAQNRIRERGAAILALTIERYGARLPLQSIILDGNAIGDIGVRACISSMAICNVAWGLLNCSPEVRPREDMLEGDRLWRHYQLDLSDPYEHLVAWKVAKLSLPSPATPEGQTWVNAKIDGASIEQADADWDPPESGKLELSIQGPIRGLECKKVFASENLSILVPLEEEGLPDRLEGTVETRKASADGGEDTEAKVASESWRVVKYVKQDLFIAGYDYVRQLSDTVGGVNQFIAERLSPNIRPGALLYVDRSRIEVTEVRRDKNEFSVAGISETLQTALTEGHRQELEFRHSFVILAPIISDEPASEPAEQDTAPEGEEAPPPPHDDGIRSCMYEARLPRATVDPVHFERIMAILASFSRAVGEEGAIMFLKTISKDLCFSIRQAEKIAETFLFVPAKRLLPFILSPSDATASLHKLENKTHAVTILGKEFASAHRPWVDHDTAMALDKHLVHQKTELWHRTDGEEFVDMVGGKFQAVRQGHAIAEDPETGMERSVLFKLVEDGDWDEPMGALSKVVLAVRGMRLVLPVLDHNVQRQTLRLGDAPLSVSGGIELGEMATVGTVALSHLTKEDEAYEFEYAEFMATPAS